MAKNFHFVRPVYPKPEQLMYLLDDVAKEELGSIDEKWFDGELEDQSSKIEENSCEQGLDTSVLDESLFSPNPSRERVQVISTPAADVKDTEIKTPVFSSPFQFDDGSLVKHLFKTPSQEFVSNSDSKTQRIVKSLGTDPNASVISWTSSLATPRTECPDVGKCDEDPIKDEVGTIGAARALFSPGLAETSSESVADFDEHLNDTIEDENLHRGELIEAEEFSRKSSFRPIVCDDSFSTNNEADSDCFKFLQIFSSQDKDGAMIHVNVMENKNSSSSNSKKNLDSNDKYMDNGKCMGSIHSLSNSCQGAIHKRSSDSKDVFKDDANSPAHAEDNSWKRLKRLISDALEGANLENEEIVDDKRMRFSVKECEDSNNNSGNSGCSLQKNYDPGGQDRLANNDDDSDNFSQLSQTSMNAMMNASNEKTVCDGSQNIKENISVNSPVLIENVDGLTSKRNYSPRNKSDSSTNCTNTIHQENPAPIIKPISANSARPSSFFNKKRTFFYPTTHQIADSRPQKIFNLVKTVEVVKPNDNKETGGIASESTATVPEQKTKPKPYIKHYSSGFTNLSSYNKMMGMKDLPPSDDHQHSTSHKSAETTEPIPSISPETSPNNIKTLASENQMNHIVNEGLTEKGAYLSDFEEDIDGFISDSQLMECEMPVVSAARASSLHCIVETDELQMENDKSEGSCGVKTDGTQTCVETSSPRIAANGSTSNQSKLNDNIEQSAVLQKSSITSKDARSLDTDTEAISIGFKKANGMDINISRSSLNKAEKLIDSIDHTIIGDGISITHERSEKKNLGSKDGEMGLHTETYKKTIEESGFHLASGKKVEISDSAKLHASSIFASLDKEFDIQKCQEVQLSPPKASFHSASGKKIFVSDNAMKKANALLSEDNLNEVLSSDITTENCFSGSKGVENETCCLSEKKMASSNMNISKGRPFTAPRCVNSVQIKDSKKDKNEGSVDSEKRNKITTAEHEKQSLATTSSKMFRKLSSSTSSSGLNDSFNDLSYTQITEVTDGTLALLQNDDDFGYTQLSKIEEEQLSLESSESKVEEHCSVAQLSTAKDDYVRKSPCRKSSDICNMISHGSNKSYADTPVDVAGQDNINHLYLFEKQQHKKILIDDLQTSALTASHKDVTKSKKCDLASPLQKVPDIDCDPTNAMESGNKNRVTNEGSSLNEIPTVNNLSSNQNTCFQTSSNDNTVVSSEKTSLINQKLTEADHKVPIVDKNPTSLKTRFQGFTTASGEEVCVSENALKTVKKLFNENTENDDQVSFGVLNRGVKDNHTIGSQAQLSFQGFHTARGKKVSVSDDALNRVRNLFEDEISKDSVDEPLLRENDTAFVDKVSFDGFCTAGGKKVEVSKESLKKVKSLFDDNLDECSESNFEMENGEKNNAMEIETGELKNAKCGEKVQSGLEMKKPTYQGFCTARGNRVTVSEKALSKVKNLFNDSDKESSFEAAKEPSTEDDRERIGDEVTKAHSVPINKMGFQGFQTARGNKVSVSDDALKKVKSLLADEISEEYENTETVDKISFGGFCTGRGKKVEVSKEALEKVKNLFGDDVDQCAESDFKSSGENISAMDMKDDIEKEEISQYALEKEHSGTERKKPPFQGFCTARGNRVTVSDEALNMVKSLFNEIDNKESCFEVATVGSIQSTRNEDDRRTLDHDSLSHECSEPMNQMRFQGFQTAGGNKVSVSDDALKKVKNLFSDDEVSLTSCDKLLLKEDDMESVKMSFGGFCTAGGKKVEVSKEALKNVKSLFDDDLHDCTESNLKMENEEKNKAMLIESGELKNAKYVENVQSGLEMKKPPYQGFCTARGNRVTVSEEALSKVKNLFNEIDSNEESNFEAAKEPSIQSLQLLNETDREKIDDAVTKAHSVPINKTAFQGFQTARGNKISVSDDALKKVKSLLADEISEEHENTESVDKISFGGFSTARGKKVEVSKEALEKVKTLFDDDLEDCDELNLKPINTQAMDLGIEVEKAKACEHSTEKVHSSPTIKKPYQGFCTARGNKVAVSDEALNKVKKMFDNENEYKEPNIEVANLDECQPLEMVNRERCNNLADESSFKGFCTAKGDKVKVSEDALKKVQNLFDNDMEGSNDLWAESDLLNNENATKSVQSEKLTGLFKVKPDANVDCDNRKPTTKDHNVSENALHHAQNCDENHAKAVDKGDRMKCEVRSDRRSSISNTKESTMELNRAFTTSSHKPIGPHQPSCRKMLNISQEASEIAQALMADGDSEDEESWSIGFSKLLDSPAVMVAEGKPKRQWMKPHSSSPEETLSDRQLQKPVTPVHTAPPNDIAGLKTNVSSIEKARWYGPTHYRPQFHAPASKSKDREAFKQMPVIRHKIGVTPNKTNIQKPGTTSAFSTPYRNTNASEKADLMSSQTVKSSTFSTPFKQTSSGSFKTPVKSQIANTTSEEKDRVIETIVEVDSQGEDETPICSAKIRASDDVCKLRLKSKIAQGQLIRKKREQGKIKPIFGKYYNVKHKINQCRISLKTAVCFGNPGTFSHQQLHTYGVHPSVLSISAENAEDYRFDAASYWGDAAASKADKYVIGDGATVILDEYSTIGKEEFCNGFLSLAGVEPGLISKEWVYNHYRSIVWKLASYEVSFPIQFGGRSLTPDQVMLQLKYRYDREIDNSQRSALKKIYEKDDTPQKALVLCISQIKDIPTDQENTADNKSHGVIELTDGWYFIKASIDRPLTSLVRKQKLVVGQKLVFYGAELVGSHDGCPPLEAPADTMLRVCTNGCRRARWDTCLGYSWVPRPPPLPLASLHPDGGTVGCVDVIVTRIYPLQYLEKTEGGNIFRSERVEMKAAQKYERERQHLLENLYSKMQVQLEKEMTKDAESRGSKKWSAKEIKSLSGSEVYDAYLESADSNSFESLLTSSQMQSLCESRRQEQERKQAELHEKIKRDMMENQSERNSVPLLKVRVAGCHTKDLDSKISTILAIWRPSDDMTSLLKEGTRFKMYNLAVSENRGKTKACDVSLTATKTTQFHPMDADDNFLDLMYEPREVTCFRELRPGFQPPYGEVDLVGIVVRVSEMSSFDRSSGDSGHVQTVYIANYLCQLVTIKFWGGLKAYALEELVHVGVAVAFSNLVFASQSRLNYLPCLTASDHCVVSTKPREQHLSVELDRLKTDVQKRPDFIEQCLTHLDKVFNPVVKAPHQPQHPTSTSTHIAKVGITPQHVKEKNRVTSPTETASDSHKDVVNVTVKESTIGKTAIEKTDGYPTSRATPHVEKTKINENTCDANDNNLATADDSTNTIKDKRKSLQEAKAAKLENFIGNMSLQVNEPLTTKHSYNSPIPTTVRRGFKPPARTASTPTGEQCQPKAGASRGRGRRSLGGSGILKSVNISNDCDIKCDLAMQKCDTVDEDCAKQTAVQEDKGKACLTERSFCDSGAGDSACGADLNFTSETDSVSRNSSQCSQGNSKRKKRLHSEEARKRKRKKMTLK